MVHFVNVEGARLWTEISGQAGEPYLVLLSGGPGCCDYLESVARMADDRYSVIRVEMRGCGRSSADGPYDMETQLRDLDAIRVYYGVPSWSLLGHSAGAGLALAYAIAYQEHTRSIVYVAGVGIQCDREWLEEFHRNQEERGEMMPEMLYPFNPQVNQEGNKSWRAYIKHPTVWRDIIGIKKPALFICAGEDIRPNWPAQQVCHAMPQARMVTIKGAGHYIWLTHRQEFMDAIRKFLI